MFRPALQSHVLSVDAAFWRRLAYAGARYGPELWLRYSPAAFGALFAAALPAQRRAIRHNLRIVKGRQSALREQLDVLGTFIGYAHCLAEGLAAERPEVVAARRRIIHRENLSRVLAGGRGALIVTAHAGPWDAAAGLLAADFGADVLVVMSAERDAEARALHDAVRKRAGVRVLHVGSHPLDALPLLRHLRGGGLAAAQLDRVAKGQRGLEVSLFGRSTRVPEGLFTLAALAGVPIVPVFAHRAGYLDYEFFAAPPIELPRRPQASELRAAAEHALRELEEFIVRHPTEWFHFEPL